MENMFYNYISKAKQLRDIVTKLKWHEKINIKNQIKISRIRKKLYAFVNSIDDMNIDIRLLKDFQHIAILNMDKFYSDCVSINFSPSKDTYIPIFYHMQFHHIITDNDIDVDIIADVINIKSSVYGNINTKYQISESDNNSKEICNAIRWCIKEYLDAWIL